MKPTVFLPLAGVAAAFFLVAAGTDSEQPPPGAAEKIAEALPAEPYAKPAKARKRWPSLARKPVPSRP